MKTNCEERYHTLLLLILSLSKAEEEKKKRLQELREEKQLEITATHFSEALLKLEELRALRANNMELEGTGTAPISPY